MNKIVNRLILFCFCATLVWSCSSDSENNVAPTVEVSVQNFTASIDENPELGTVIGSVGASTTSGSLNYQLVSQTPTGAVNINASNGEITVADVALFDFETNPTISGTFSASSGTVTETGTFTINLNDVEESTAIVWSGARITFSKAADADPNAEASQDRITDNVWITRGNDGGQIFNIRTESTADKNQSPIGTAWALGTTAELSSLTFEPFRDAVGSPQGVVGKNLVLHLIEDNIYIDIKFTNWGTNKNGSFAYERSTE